MFFNIWNPSCQSRIAVLNIRFSVSIVLLLLPRETRLSILFDVKSARGIPNFLTPRKAQKTSSCWCVMSVAKRSSNKKCYRVIDLAHIIGAVCTCWLSRLAVSLSRWRWWDGTQIRCHNKHEIYQSQQRGDKCEIRQVHYQTIDLNEDKRAVHGKTPRCWNLLKLPHKYWLI